MKKDSQQMIFIGLIIVILAVLLYYLVLKPPADTSIVHWALVDAHQTSLPREGRVIKIDDQDLSGSEFSISFWMYISDWSWNYGKYKHVMHLGTNTDINEGNITVRLHPTINKMIVSAHVYPDNLRTGGVFMANSVNEPERHESVGVNVPVQKWINVVISVQDRSLDVYTNGELIVSKMLSGVIKNVHMKKAFLTKFGGFKGKIGRVKISNRIVNAEKVFSNYRQELSGIMMPLEFKLSNGESDVGTDPDDTTDSRVGGS